jgi:small subunit ribosomal protein S6
MQDTAALEAETEIGEPVNESMNGESVNGELAAAMEAGADNVEDSSDDGATEASAQPDEAAPATRSTPDAEGFTSALPTLAPESTPREHVVGGVGYEIIYVVRAGDPALVETSSQRVRELIEQGEGAIDNVRASEVRRFAYPIKKQTEGVYVVVNARFKPEFTGELDRYFKIDENILRHMMLKEER